MVIIAMAVSNANRASTNLAAAAGRAPLRVPRRPRRATLTRAGEPEEFVRSVHVLEALLPAWFAGASEELGKMARMKELSRHNPLTGTNMSGCVSDEARHLP